MLHTIGGDDTNTAGADLSAFLAREGYNLCVDRPAEDDRQRRVPDHAVLGAWTAALEGAKFFENVGVGDPAPEMMIVHEVMGRVAGLARRHRQGPSATESRSGCCCCRRSALLKGRV